MIKSLQEQLMSMQAADLALRAQLLQAGVLFDGYHPEMQKLHQANAEALMAILDEHGWPTPDLVGTEGTSAAWMIMQHAIGNPPLLRKSMQMIEHLGDASGVTALDKARTMDRIRYFEGKKQLYGTNFDWDEQGLLSPTPIEEADKVDQRRAQIGLDPLQKSIESIRARAKAEGEVPPRDPQRRREEFEAWIRETGWRG